MNSKQFLFTLGILAVLALSFASASLTINTNTAATLNSIKGVSIPISFNITGATDTYTSLDFNHTITSTASFSFDSKPTSINTTETKTVTGTITVPSSFNARQVILNVNVYNGTTSLSSPQTYTVNLYSLDIIVSQTLSRDQNATIRINNTGFLDLNNINLTVSDSRVSLSNNIIGTLSPGLSDPITAYFSTIPSSLDVNTITLTAKANNATDTETIGGVNPKFCRNGSRGALEISDFDINNKGEGDDNTWNPGDSIEIDVEVSNTGDDSISNVNLDIKIVDSSGRDVTDDFDLEEDSIEIGKIKGDDEKTATFIINSVPGLDEDEYKLFFKAYKSASESSICDDSFSGFSNSNYELITIEKEWDQAVIVQEDSIQTITASCGDTINLNFDVYNIGTDREESVLVVIENRELGLKQSQVISDLDENDKSNLDFSVVLPKNLSKTSYYVDISTYFDYDGDGDVYDIDSYDQSSYDDLDKSYKFPIKVENCQSQQSQSAITASLTSTAKLGNELTIKATITNIATSSADFIVSAADYESWANLVSIEPQVVNIAAGQSKDVIITLKPTEAGTNTFNIKTISNGKTTTQLVQISVAQKSGFLTSAFSGAGSTTMYILVVVFILLIIIVLFMIMRVIFSGKKESYKSEF